MIALNFSGLTKAYLKELELGINPPDKEEYLRNNIRVDEEEWKFAQRIIRIKRLENDM